VVREVIDEADIVVEVVDARDPIGTRNLKVERLVKESGKKLLIAMNKADLVPKEWAEEYKKKSDVPMVFISARERKGTGILRREIKKIAKELFDEGKVYEVLLVTKSNLTPIGIIRKGNYFYFKLFEGKSFQEIKEHPFGVVH
ncbi:DUF447 domain-containing protein, partial [Thermococcus sp. 21S9]|uniref:DUF447 domain-containing protein n=1 Tax=Thermococcus sp. 21S9 TaxID=1638223 RepID=UPI001F112E5D